MNEPFEILSGRAPPAAILVTHLAFYDWLENTAFGTWIRESPWGFPISLIVHVWSLAFVGGVSLLFALAIFGFAPRLLPQLLDKYLPLTWTAFSVSLLSGLALLTTYPDKVLTSEVFFVKMALVAAALALVVSLQRRTAALRLPYPASFPSDLKLRAAGVLLAWFCAIVTGRLLYYTY